MMFVSYSSNTTGTTSGAELLTFPEHLSSSQIYCPIFSFLFSFLYIIVCHFVLFLWPLYCLSFFDLRLLITPLVSSTFQHTWPLGHVSYCYHFSSVVRPSTFHILIFSSETTGPIATKLWWNGPWMAPFQNCVR